MAECKVALITGGNRGIGLEICRQLAEKGLQIILTARNKQKGTAACRKLAAEGKHITFYPLDVTDPDNIHCIGERIVADFGRLDVLVNNAGISPEHGRRGTEVDMQTVRQTLDTNLLGPWMLCRTFIPLMRRQDYGRIVNVSSGKGSFVRLAADYPAYRISKTALNALTVVLADELRDTNILVNAMTPGWVRTRLGGIYAPRSVKEGAETAVWLATCADDGPRGKFFKDQKEFPW
jgi:NAD(P)-dependent dehydrogenase (short-subunit alcohol dehydrogenase family)